jgi:hypothetical protein
MVLLGNRLVWILVNGIITIGCLLLYQLNKKIMGYRNYIASIPKREYNRIKSLTVQQVYDYKQADIIEDSISVYDFGKQLYEFGKYVEFNPPKKSVKTFFKKKETQQKWNDEDELFVVTKEFLAYIIDTYNKRVQKYYDAMVLPFLVNGQKFKSGEFLNSVKVEYDYPDNKYQFDFTKITDDEQNALYKMIEHIRSFRSEWVSLTPYDLYNGDSVTTSWKYEYEIFELVRIYKSFDWKKNVMYYYGY